MGYDIELLDATEERTAGHEKASVIYTFSISNGERKTVAKIILTSGGAAVIEQKGKDPKAAARIALNRLLKSGRDPYQTQIFIHIPHGHAEHFSKYGNFDSLPVLRD